MRKRYKVISFMFRPTKCRFYTCANGNVRLWDKRTKAVKQFNAWTENLKNQYKDKMDACWYEKSTTQSVFLAIQVEK